MAEMIVLYRSTIIAGAVMAAALALLGIQLAARDRAMQTVCVGQGASVGVILGMGVLHWFDLHHTLVSLLPFLTGLGISVLTYLVSDRLVARRMASRNTVFAFIFSVLVAMVHLMGSLFPGLEMHLTQIYFGDLATLTEQDSHVATALGLIAICFFLAGQKPITLFSFDSHLVGEGRVLTRANFFNRAFPWVAIALVCLSVQFLGFLFTTAALFVPTAMLSFFPSKGLRRHVYLSFASASTAALVGFVVSLKFTRLPTVPTVVAALFVILLWLYLSERLAKR